MKTTTTTTTNDESPITPEERAANDAALLSLQALARIQNQKRLDAAFALVSNPADWKAGIDAYVTGAEFKDVYEAIIHFTATVPAAEYVGVSNGGRVMVDGKSLTRIFPAGEALLRVRADGYRMGPAGCH